MTETKETYNGYANFETWNVCLWINNEQGAGEYLLEMIDEQDDYTAEDTLKDYFKYEMNPLVDVASMYSDILSAALSEVNWREVLEVVKEYKSE